MLQHIQTIRPEVPIAWREILDQLHGAGGAEKKQYVMLKDVETLAEAHNVSKVHVPAMLELFHELGVLLYFGARPELKDIVILQPQWLMNAICRLLCDFELHRIPVHTVLEDLIGCPEPRPPLE